MPNDQKESLPATQKLYRRWYRAYQMMIWAIGHERALARRLDRVACAPGMRALDAGCGSGAATRALLASAAMQGVADVRVDGFDFTEAAVRDFNAFTARRGLAHVRARTGDALNLDGTLPDDWRGYDLLLSSGMLEYLPPNELPRALDALRRRLSPGGRAIVFISRDTPFNRLFLGKLWRANVYRADALASAFAQAGFRVESIEPFQTWGFAVEAINA